MNATALMYVAIGGALGSMCRYVLMTLVTRYNPGDFPWHTFAVNALGGFLMGAWIAAMETMLPERARELHTLIAAGVLGGFTTFSAFSVDVYLLFSRGAVMQASLYVTGSVVLSVLALYLGMWCLRHVA